MEVRGWEAVETAYTFFGIVVGRFKYGKMGDHQKKKFFINNTVEAVVAFKKEHQGLLKLHVPLGRGSSSVAKRSGECPQKNFNPQILTSY